MFEKKIKKASEIEVNTLRQRVSNIAESVSIADREIISLNNKFDRMNDMLLALNKRIDLIYELISKN